MKFQRIIESVYFQPWSITRAGWQSIHEILKPYLGARVCDPQQFQDRTLKVSVPLQDDSPDEDYFGNPIPKMQITPDGVAIIPIMGVLIHHASLMDKKCGACSFDDIKRDVRAALGTNGLRKIVFHVDSPGGTSQGCEETVVAIEEAARVVPTEAVTDTQIASAAYHIICPVGRIYCTPSAEVGCIGTLLPWLDQSVRYEMAGLEMRVFKTDELKGAGWPGTSLSEEQEAYFQATVDKFGAMFKSRVRTHRVVGEDAMRGQCFVGSDAVDAGIADEVIDDVELRFADYSAVSGF